MPASLDPQLALDERAVTDDELERTLELHLRARDDVTEARGVAKQRRRDVDAALTKHGDFPPDTALRVGRFRITKRLIPADHREFDVAEREQISFSLVDADGKPSRRSSTSKAAEKSVSDDFDDLRPTGEVNVDALRGEAERSSEPTPIRPGGSKARRNAAQPPATH